jgi:hypothetical protein
VTSCNSCFMCPRCWPYRGNIYQPWTT